MSLPRERGSGPQPSPIACRSRRSSRRSWVSSARQASRWNSRREAPSLSTSPSPPCHVLSATCPTWARARAGSDRSSGFRRAPRSWYSATASIATTSCKANSETAGSCARSPRSSNSLCWLIASFHRAGSALASLHAHRTTQQATQSASRSMKSASTASASVSPASGERWARSVARRRLPA